MRESEATRPGPADPFGCGGGAALGASRALDPWQRCVSRVVASRCAGRQTAGRTCATGMRRSVTIPWRETREDTKVSSGNSIVTTSRSRDRGLSVRRFCCEVFNLCAARLYAPAVRLVGCLLSVLQWRLVAQSSSPRRGYPRRPGADIRASLSMPHGLRGSAGGRHAAPSFTDHSGSPTPGCGQRRWLASSPGAPLPTSPP